MICAVILVCAIPVAIILAVLVIGIRDFCHRNKKLTPEEIRAMSRPKRRWNEA